MARSRERRCGMEVLRGKGRFGIARSVNLGFVAVAAGGPRRLEEIEVAAVVGLADVLLVERAEAAVEARRGRLPAGAAARELGIVDVQVELAPGHVQRDGVAVADERERSADV